MAQGGEGSQEEDLEDPQQEAVCRNENLHSPPICKQVEECSCWVWRLQKVEEDRMQVQVPVVVGTGPAWKPLNHELGAFLQVDL